MDVAPDHGTANEASVGPGEMSTAMSTIERIRNRRIAKRDARAIDRAWKSAPTQSMRDEIAIFSQQRVF
ncbi:hypothetical protein GCM10020358_45490 [Amorphoplanes nipponensis]